MSDKTSTSLGVTVQLTMDMASAQEKTTAALKAEGFGILTEIDVKETLKKKLDVEFRPYKILGACNPNLAYRALQIAPEIGLLLPCNVTLTQLEDGVTQVSLVDPLAMMSAANHADLEPVAREAGERLARVAAALQQAA